MTAARLLGTTVGAPWLPPGSDAEVWVGDLDSLPEPSIIVRLLLTRHAGDGPARFFCVPGAKGLDLPTRFLEPGPERSDPAVGVGRLVAQVLGVREVGTHCVGFVRNYYHKLFDNSAQHHRVAAIRQILRGVVFDRRAL